MDPVNRIPLICMSHPLIHFLLLYRSISKKEQAIIESAFEFEKYREDESLCPPGRIHRNLFFISGGVLRIVKINDKGDHIIHFFIKENQFCTILDSFNNEVVAEESIEAAVDTEVYKISKINLMNIYLEIPWLKELIDEITQQRLLEKVRMRNAYLGLDSSARYRLFLTTHSDIALRISLGDMAAYLGITPQSLSRIRRNALK